MKWFEIDQAVEPILGSETVEHFVPMLPDTPFQVAGYADVQRSVSLVGYDIDVVHITSGPVAGRSHFQAVDQSGI